MIRILAFPTLERCKNRVVFDRWINKVIEDILFFSQVDIAIDKDDYPMITLESIINIILDWIKFQDRLA